MNRTYLTNCTLILPNETLRDGAIAIEDDVISAICPEKVADNFFELDLRGATLMPGMIDLHCDAVESLAEPRSGIYLPFDLAAKQADQLAAMNGITTFYNAISFAGEELGLRKEDAPSRLVRALRKHRAHALTDQRVHCRFEVTCEESLPKILDFIRDGSCEFVSYMDHSPGQGQFQDEANYRSYVSARYGYSDSAITELLNAKAVSGGDRSLIQSRIDELSAVAQAHQIPLAGHDADSPEHVEQMVALGAVLAEFPMSSAAAMASLTAGLHQSVGSVNVIRGGSQRTGMSAMQLIEAGQADCLCSDYVPATLLPAMLKVSQQLNRPLHEMIKLVTANPARAAGLLDRGTIQIGMKADLVAFQMPEETDLPVIHSTWSHGRLAYATFPPQAGKLTVC